MPARILVIEDDAAFRAMLCEALVGQGHDPEGVGSAEEGLDRARAETFDLVLTDVMLPGMDGIEGLSRLKDACPQAEVIVMTGYAAKEKALQAAAHAREVGVEKAKEIASDVDKSVHQNPWPYVAGTACVGLLLGYILGRNRK